MNAYNFVPDSFHTGVTMISHQRGQFDPKLKVQGVAPPIIFGRLVRPMNALQLYRWQFSHKETL